MSVAAYTSRRNCRTGFWPNLSRMQMRLTPVARGLLTLVPALHDLLPARNVGHTASAQYCYGVWLKHLTLLHAHGMTTMPQSLAELGPGDSLGVGMCALLSGSEHYVGLD